MGLPLILVGIGAGKFMPKPGGWMSTVSKTFGVVMLGVAIFMIGKIVPGWLRLYYGHSYLWETGIILGVFDGLPF